MHLTPAILEQAYTYLKATPPFCKWGLPEADDVEFRVTGHRTDFGDCESDLNGAKPIIRISGRLCGKTDILIRTLSHELCHLRRFITDFKARDYSTHGPKFQKLAAQVCRSHGWDVETF